MKRFFTLALYCLCLVGVSAQTPSGADPETTATNGSYLFEKAVLSISNYKTNKIVDRKTITDTASINPRDIHLENILFEAKLLDGKLVECVLPDKQRYKLDETMRLKPAMDDKLIALMREDEIVDTYLLFGQELRPYDFRIEGEKMIVTFAKYNFGQSDVNYTMVAELVVTLTKQKER